MRFWCLNQVCSWEGISDILPYEVALHRNFSIGMTIQYTRKQDINTTAAHPLT